MPQKDLYLGPDFSEQKPTPVSNKPYNVEEQLAGFNQNVKVETKGKKGKHQQAPAQTVSAGLTPYDN